MESITMSCIICGKNTNHFFHPKTHVLFHQCPHCEAIFKDPKHYPTEVLERKTYDDHNNSVDDIKYVNYLNNFIDSAVLPFKKEGKLLDFGSGPVPVLSTLFKKLGTFEVDIYDVHYANDLKFMHERYDVITSTEVIEHLKDPLETFKMLKDHLKPDGILSIMTLFSPKDHKQFLDWFYIRDVTHLVFFTPKTIKVIADLIGMKVIDCNDYRYAVLKNT